MNAVSSPAKLDIRRILCCVSEGTFSDDAVDAASRLGQALNARVEFLHVLEVPELLGTRFDRRQIEAMNATRAEELQAVMRAHLSHRHPDLQANGRPVADQLEVVPGTPQRTLLEQARERRADLIVLGDSGKRKQLDFGGVARAVLAKGELPVLLQTRRPTAVRDILVPTDLSGASLAALRQAIDLATQLGARVHVLHCVPLRAAAAVIALDTFHAQPPEELHAATDAARDACEEELAELDWRDVEHDLEVVEGSASECILAAQGQVDLIAMGTHGHTGLAAALLGGVAYHVMRQAHTPVLALRDPGRRFVF
jgi:nucleotide-binding universal stress UspA family protein